MFAPTRLAYSFRLHASPAMLAAAVATALLFAATPFLIPEISDRLGVTEGLAGAISLAQVGAFAAANFILPRTTSPSRRLFVGAAAALVVANVLSAATGQFALLMLARVLTGAAAGTLTWMVWGDAMRRPRALSAVAAAGPVTALLAAPLFAALSDLGDPAMFLALAVAALPVMVLPCRMAPPAPRRARRRVSRSRSNRLLLAALFVLTLSGASLFTFEAVVVREVVGLGPLAASLGFSLNAFGGLVGARLAHRHRRPGLWLATAGPAALLTVVGGNALGYYVGMTWWGFAFWMGVPGILQMLSDRSLEPAERAGDAQGFMAMGRAVAPVIGGGLLDAGAYTALAIVAGTGIAAAGLTVAGVEEGRDRLPPTDPLTVAETADAASAR